MSSFNFFNTNKKGMGVQSTVDTFFEESNLEKKTGHSGTRILDALFSFFFFFF